MFPEEGGCHSVPRRSDTCDSTDTLCTGDISEVRKMGHEGIISHQICRTCPQLCHIYSVSVTKVPDSGRNSQGLRSEQNSCMPSAHQKAQLAASGGLCQVSARQQKWRGGDLHTSIYLFKTLQLPSGHVCLVVTELAVVQREVNKSLLRGKMLLFFNS